MICHWEIILCCFLQHLDPRSNSRWRFALLWDRAGSARFSTSATPWSDLRPVMWHSFYGHRMPCLCVFPLKNCDIPYIIIHNPLRYVGLPEAIYEKLIKKPCKVWLKKHTEGIRIWSVPEYLKIIPGKTEDPGNHQPIPSSNVKEYCLRVHPNLWKKSS